MARQVDDVIGDDRADPERGALNRLQSLDKRRDPDQERGPSQSLRFDCPGRGPGSLEINLVG
jgi:hypothetical protein